MPNPTPARGEVWRIRFDPAEGDEIKKTRTAVVINDNAIGRLKLKICRSNHRVEVELSKLPLVCAARADA